MYKRLSALLFLCLWICVPSLTAAARAHAQERHLCIVPVLHGKAEEAGIGNYQLNALGPKVFKNSALLVTHTWSSTIDAVTASTIDAFTLNANCTLLPIPTSGFPSDQLRDRFGVEPDGRVVGIGAQGRIYIADPGAYQFSPVQGTATGVAPPIWLTAFGATGIVTKNGLMLLKSDNLVPVDGIDWSKTGPLWRVFDLPHLNITALATEDGRLFLLDSEKRLTQVPGIDVSGLTPGGYLEKDQIDWVVEVSNPSRLFVHDLSYHRRNYVVSFQRDGSAYTPSRAAALPTMGQSTDWSYYPEVGQVLAVGSPGIFSRSGLYKLDGATPVRVERGNNPLSGQVFLHGIPSRHEVIITSAGGISVYDGRGPLRDVKGSTDQSVGPSVFVYDLPTLDKVLIAGAQGVFELSKDDRLVPLPLPPDTGTYVGKVVEMPASQAAVVFTDKTVLALDRLGHFSPVAGADRVEPRTLGFNDAVWIPVRGEVFIEAQNDHFLVRDEAITGPGSCDAAERRVPPEKECSVPFDSPDLGIAGPITTVAEAAHERRVLISTPKGGFQVDDQGNVSLYAPLANAGIYLSFPWGAHLLQTQTGYELLEPDGSRHPISTNWGHYTYLENVHYIGFARRAHTWSSSVTAALMRMFSGRTIKSRLSQSSNSQSKASWRCLGQIGRSFCQAGSCISWNSIAP